MKIGGFASWICASVFCGVLTACFGGGDTRDPGDKSGGSGGGGGGGGEAGSASFPCSDKADTVAALPLDQAKCSMYATVEDVEKALIRNTGASGCRNAVCHAVKTTGTRKGLPLSEPFIQPTRAFVELAGVTNRQKGQDDFNVCPNDKYIDIDDPQKSFLLTKVRDEMPACADGTTHPQSKQMPNTPTKLSPEQVACVEAYVTAVSEGCRP